MFIRGQQRTSERAISEPADRTVKDHTYLGIVLVNVFVVGHLHQPVTQVIVRKDEEA